MLQIKAGGSANYICAVQREKQTGLSPYKSHSCLIAPGVRKGLKLTQLLPFLVHGETAVLTRSSPHILVLCTQHLLVLKNSASCPHTLFNVFRMVLSIISALLNEQF